MAKFKSNKRRKPRESEERCLSLFDAVYSKQTKDVRVHAGLMDVFYSQSTSVKRLNELKRKHKRSF